LSLFAILGQYSEIQFNKTSFEITTVTHPSTYLNKILFGSKQGRLELWNIKKNTMIYSFKGWGQPVTVVEQVSILGYGQYVRERHTEAVVESTRLAQ
jgi:U3 small nucleolar RNA-associated protein 21